MCVRGSLVIFDWLPNIVILTLLDKSVCCRYACASFRYMAELLGESSSLLRPAFTIVRRTSSTFIPFPLDEAALARVLPHPVPWECWAYSFWLVGTHTIPST